MYCLFSIRNVTFIVDECEISVDNLIIFCKIDPMNSFNYIKQYYGVHPFIGQRVRHNGNGGIILKDRGNYLGVNFDSDCPTAICNVHPTDGVEYLERGEARQLSKKKMKAKQRYQRYLEYGDGFNNFLDFCHWDSDPEKSWNRGY